MRMQTDLQHATLQYAIMSAASELIAGDSSWRGVETYSVLHPACDSRHATVPDSLIYCDRRYSDATGEARDISLHIPVTVSHINFPHL